MGTSNQMATALLAEHFRHTPLTLLDDIINIVNELVYRAVNAIEAGLNNTSPESLGFNANGTASEEAREAVQEAKQTEIDCGIVQLETLLNATIDKDFDKFEIFTLRNILAVGHEEEDLARWVQLEHYRNLHISDNENTPSPEQVQLQRRKLHETAKLNAMLKAEEARNAAVLSQLQTLLGVDDKSADISPFAFLSSAQHSAKGSGEQPLQQNVQYALSQLPALRQHLAQLKSSLQTLPNARHQASDESSDAAKRRRYLDAQSRRILDRKGIEPEPAASVAAGAGKKMSKDEVEGMEAVVQALGGAQASRRSNDEMEE